MRFHKYYALPDFRVAQTDWHKHECAYEELEVKASAGLMICIDLQNEDYGVLDYDAHHGDSGKQAFREHRAAYPDFFANTRIEVTGNGGRHVYFKKVGALPAKPFDAEVDVLAGQDHRWLVIPPSMYKDGKRAAYEVTQDLEPQGLPTGLLDSIRAARKPSSKHNAGAVAETPTFLANWTPRKVKVTMPKTRGIYNASHVRRVLCDCFEGYYTYKRETEDGTLKPAWAKTDRHSELWHYLNDYFKDYIKGDKFVGKSVLNEAFTIATNLNDKWQCANCKPKFASEEQVKQDVVRFLRQYDVKYPDPTIISAPVKRIEGSTYFHESPHSINVIGYTEARKSVLTGSHILRDWHSNVGGPVIWLSDDEKASDVNSKLQGQAYVYSTQDADGASAYVFEDGASDIIGSVHRAMEMAEEQGADLNGPWLLVIDPMTAFQKMYTQNGFNKTVDEYQRVYAIQGLVSRTFPNAYVAYLLHSNEESKDNTGGKAFGSMGWQARSRFWVKCRKTDDEVTTGGTVTIGGNWVQQNTTYDMDLSNFPDIELKPYRTVEDPVAVALRELFNTGETADTGVLPRLKALGLRVVTKDGVIRKKLEGLSTEEAYTWDDEVSA